MQKKINQKPDYFLSLVVFGLIVFGLIMIYSVSKYYSLQITDNLTDKLYLKKQLWWVFLGILAWAVFQNIDYKFWQKKTHYMLFITFGLPILPIIFGGGSGERWVDLGFMSFQPSEVAKMTLIFYLAGWFSSKGKSVKELQKLFPAFCVIAGAISMIMLIQKDLGTLGVMICILAVLFSVAGASIYQLFAGLGLGGFLFWLAIKIEPYRIQRLLTFLNPEDNTLGAGYQIRNALIAIGSGGLLGLGFGQSKQKYLYLPEAHTDSIFAIISEELGFVRAIILVILFVIVAMRGYKIAMQAPDSYSRLVAAGITTWLFSQMFINVAAMLSLIPLTGVPLPFVSYGGSSLLILLAAVGILINISKQRVITTK